MNNRPIPARTLSLKRAGTGRSADVPARTIGRILSRIVTVRAVPA